MGWKLGAFGAIEKPALDALRCAIIGFADGASDLVRVQVGPYNPLFPGLSSRSLLAGGGLTAIVQAGVAQLVEHDVANVVVVGSNPITRSLHFRRQLAVLASGSDVHGPLRLPTATVNRVATLQPDCRCSHDIEEP